MFVDRSACKVECNVTYPNCAYNDFTIASCCVIVIFQALSVL
ncbi:hypothetical protein APHNP_0434 [Anaplasma phagocytophilum str. ApNP]|uniref:Uncharacterized protein n=2 Tax=Anaplasma phagocytophilum TaxID=948 RepID=A0A0F3NI75_ANAPH|nr:hypothetical protein APHMUC_0634 [Anaplasma phagocytophilum str. ApMUC09]KJV67715.1 hypothetical protein APHNP_0434 [Anaplasma phagocytophilum str. ApNP]